MAILKDHPNGIQFPQNLLKPKFISYNKKDIVSIIFNNIFFLDSDEVKFSDFDVK